MEKLTGNKKFDVDERLELPQFIKLIETVCENDIENQKVLLEKMEDSMKGNMTNKDDHHIVKLTQVLKEMKKAASKK